MVLIPCDLYFIILNKNNSVNNVVWKFAVWSTHATFFEVFLRAHSVDMSNMINNNKNNNYNHGFYPHKTSHHWNIELMFTYQNMHLKYFWSAIYNKLKQITETTVHTTIATHQMKET